MPLNEFIRQGQEVLRCGYTTGTCAALATKACGISLFTKEIPEKVSIYTPSSVLVEVNTFHCSLHETSSQCSVRKDGGDDIDVTHGAEIVVSLTLLSEGNIVITGGEGVGKVTKNGLDQPVGEYAINSTPRTQICDVLNELREQYQYFGGFLVEISVPLGKELAKKTFNEKLGILGGISILGTTGIVLPRSHSAIVSTIETELKMLQAMGATEVILTPGNFGAQFLREHPSLQRRDVVEISNFLGDTLDLLEVYGFETVLLVGHLGKLVKVAGGIMNTHSRYADCRVEIFSAYTALCGGSPSLIEKLMSSATSDACINLLEEAKLKEKVLEKICESAENHLKFRVKEKISIGYLTFTNQHGLLACSQNGQKIIESWHQSS